MRPVLGVVLAAAVGLAAVVFAAIVGTNGKFDVTVTKAASNSRRDSIVVVYTPDTTKVNCSPIYLTQTCRDVDQNGKVIHPKRYKSGAFEHLQDDMTPGGTYVDHSVCEKDPYYNGEDSGKDAKSAGSSDGHTAKSTRMSDAVNINDSSYPDSVTTIVSTFEVCAICKQDGKILDCVTWTWTRAKGSAGKGSITAPTAAAVPSQEFKDAVAKYKTNHQDGTVCPEAVAEIHKGEKNVTSGTSKKLPLDPPPAHQPFNVQWDIVNTGPTDVTGVTWSVWLDGGFLAGGVVPSIGWFDFATVTFPAPPLPPGPHTLTYVVDSDYLIPEYDEADNLTDEEFIFSDVSGVGPAPAGRAIGITALQPNPARSRVAATVSLAGTGRATLELLDLGGRRIREFPLAGTEFGIHTVHLELGSTLRPGMYLLRLRQGGQAAVRKVTVVK
jgi:hypothetical protein